MLYVAYLKDSLTTHNLLQTGKCKVLHKCETDIDGELSLNWGDVNVTTAWINDEWLSGRLWDKEWIFPVSFVELLEELPQSNVRELMSYACGWGWDENECVVCQHVYNILYVFKMLMILD